jgi:peptidoglycan hydrolase FlgJ
MNSMSVGGTMAPGTMPPAMMPLGAMPGATPIGAAVLGATPTSASSMGATLPGAVAPSVMPSGTTTSSAMATPSADTAAAPDPKIWQAAKNFEAMAIGELLGPMFDTVNLADSKFGGGQAETAWKPMLVSAIGKQIEAHGGFGLAQPIYSAMLRVQEARTQPGASGQPTVHHSGHQSGKTS